MEKTNSLVWLRLSGVLWPEKICLGDDIWTEMWGDKESTIQWLLVGLFQGDERENAKVPGRCEGQKGGQHQWWSPSSSLWLTYSNTEPCPLHVGFPRPQLGTGEVHISRILMFEETLPRLQVHTKFRDKCYSCSQSLCSKKVQRLVQTKPFTKAQVGGWHAMEIEKDEGHFQEKKSSEGWWPITWSLAREHHWNTWRKKESTMKVP